MRDYIRPSEPEPKKPAPPKRWQFTERDQNIVLAIARYEGFLSVPQVWDLFFPPSDAARKRVYKRLELLWQAGYLRRPTRRERRCIPEMIYWLDKKGAEFLESEGAGFSVPRKIRGQWRHKLLWVKKPRLIQIRHDMMVNEFHLDVELSCRETGVELADWRPGYVLASDADEVSYHNLRGRPVSRKYLPDGFFVLVHNQQRRRFLLEIDRGREGKEQVHRVMNEKILLGVPYIKSRAYQEKFGHNSGRMLIVTSGMGRLENMLGQTANKIGDLAQWFLFTTFDQVTPESVVTEPIWHSYKKGKFTQVSLITG